MSNHLNGGGTAAALAVIFDMDGTLLDTETVCDRTWEIAAKDLNLAVTSNLINSCRGTNTQATLAILSEHFKDTETATNFLARTSVLFHEIEKNEGLPLKPFAKESLEYLRGRGYKIALASSTRYESVQRQLTAAGLIDFFASLTTGDMVTHSKPAPEIYLKAAASIGVLPENCVAVEDAPHGVKSAVGAGMRCVMVPDKIAPTAELRKITWKICGNLQELSLFL